MSDTFTLKIPTDIARTTSMAIRSLPNAYFNSVTGRWTFRSLDIEILANHLRGTHPLLADLLNSSPRFESARNHIEKLVESIVLSHATDIDIDLYTPPGLSLYPFQKVGVHFGMDKDKSGVLIADQMGCGKSPQALSIINNLGIKTTLIVCPNVAKVNWLRESKKWLDKQNWIHIISAENKLSISEAGKGVVSIINYNMLPKYADRLSKVPFECIIADEAHFIKNEKSARSKAVYSVAKKIPKKIALTGTPMSNGRPIDLWGIISWLDPKTWLRKHDFELRYCAGKMGYWGWENTGSSNESELQSILRSTIMIRRLKKDVLQELPAKQRTIIEIPKDKNYIFLSALKKEDKYKNQVERLLQKAQDANSPQEYLDIMRSFSLSFESDQEMAKIRKETALAKLPEVLSFIQSIVEQGEKVVVFSHHRDVTTAVYNHFKPYSRIAIGGDNPKDRQQGIDDFQKKEDVSVWVGSFTAAGTAITLTAASIVVMAELMYDPASMDQAEDRLHRIGQVNSVQVYYLVLEGSIDARIAELIVSKMDMIAKVLDGENSQDNF